MGDLFEYDPIDDDPKGEDCRHSSIDWPPRRSNEVTTRITDVGLEATSGERIHTLAHGMRQVIVELLNRHSLAGASRITDESQLSYKVDGNGVIIAFAVVTPGPEKDDLAHVNWIYVPESQRGKGLGPQMFDYIQEKYPQGLSGEIATGNRAMEHLATKSGAKICGTQKTPQGKEYGQWQLK